MGPERRGNVHGEWSLSISPPPEIIVFNFFPRFSSRNIRDRNTFYSHFIRIDDFNTFCIQCTPTLFFLQTEDYDIFNFVSEYKNMLYLVYITVNTFILPIFVFGKTKIFFFYLYQYTFQFQIFYLFILS